MTYECNCIARNPIQPNLVAAGYERSAKYEQKSCLLVWDINQQGAGVVRQAAETYVGGGPNLVCNMYNVVDPETITEEKISFAQVSDGVGALCWLPESDTDLLAAMKDSLIMCDIRASWKKQIIEEDSNQEVKGIRFDPFDKNRYATISKQMVKVYDIRINRPQYVLIGDESSEFMGFDWSQYCKSLIATFSKNSSIVKFWDLNNVESEKAKQTILLDLQTKVKRSGVSEKAKKSLTNVEDIMASSVAAETNQPAFVNA